MTDRLSRDFYHPDCPECDTPGWAAVVMRGLDDGDWLCSWCGAVFDSEPDSEWYGVVDLPPRQRRVYIDRRIRGLSAREVRQRGRTPGQVGGVLAASTKAIEARRADADV